MFRQRLVKEAAVLSRSLSTLQRQTPAARFVPNTTMAENSLAIEKQNFLRRQHQLATIDDTQHREALKLFVEALHLRFGQPQPTSRDAPTAEIVDEIQSNEVLM